MSGAHLCDIRLVARRSLLHTLALRNRALSSSSPHGNGFDTLVDGNEYYPSLEGTLKCAGVLSMGHTTPLLKEV